MAYVADYDPSGYDAADPLTWPQPAPYSPGDWWYVTGPGTVGDVAVDLGDRVYPIGTGRLYGELNYGDDVYGGPVPDPPWPADPARVRWTGRAWSSAPGWNRPPAPYAGEPYGDHGWRLCVEVYAIDPDARLYGSGNYGDGVYGDTVVPAEDWRDLSCPIAGIRISRGGVDASPYVEVDQADLTIVDADAVWFPITNADVPDDGIVRTPTRGTPIRVSLIDPTGDPHPAFTGRIDTATDVADRPPRTVDLTAFGMGSDLVTVVDAIDRPAEAATTRLGALRDLAGYVWGWNDPDPTPAATLRRTDRQVGAEVRDWLDRTALSAGLSWRADARGVVTFYPWPPTIPAGVPDLVVTDRLGAGALPIVAAEVVTDPVELLNRVVIGSEPVQGSPALVAVATDAQSVGRFGRSDQAFGFPILDLFAQQDDLDDLAAAIRDRFGRIVNRVAAITVSTDHDPRWGAVLADVDYGTPLRVVQTEPRPVTWDAVVVGAEVRVGVRPDVITADLYLSTITPTL